MTLAFRFSFEQAIMQDDYSPVLHAILAQFIENLSPKAATKCAALSRNA